MFSVNQAELAHTIGKFYGNGFDAGRYLNRFFDLTIPLYKANYTKVWDKLKIYDNNWFNEMTKCICDASQFELREIQKFVGLTKLVSKSMMNLEKRVWASDRNSVEILIIYVCTHTD